MRSRDFDDARRGLPGGFRLALALFCGTLLASGCESKSPLVRVRGVVTLDGNPLASGVVQFHPMVGQVASGDIGPGGEFSLSTHAKGDGVLPGTYRVTVVAYHPDAVQTGPEHLLVPLRYTRSGSSDIEVTIFPGATAPVKIELVSADQADATSSGDSSRAGPSEAESGTVAPRPDGDTGDAGREQSASR